MTKEQALEFVLSLDPDMKKEDVNIFAINFFPALNLLNVLFTYQGETLNAYGDATCKWLNREGDV